MMFNTFSSVLFSDEQELRFFRDAVEKMLRQGEADEALRRVLLVIDRLEAPTHPLVRQIAQAERSTIRINGWSAFAATTQTVSRNVDPITAIEVDISWPGHIDLKPDANGWLEPYLETVFYIDSRCRYRFSGIDRAELLRSYVDGKEGFTWVGRFEEAGNHVTIEGLGGVYGAVYRLRAAGAAYAPRTKGYAELSALEHDLYDLGSIYVAVRLYIAVRDAVLNQGLPRPLTVLLGSNEEYPFFAAPVITAEEYTAAWGDRVPPSQTAAEPEIGSLGSLYGRKAKRRQEREAENPELEDIANALVQVIGKRMGKRPKRPYEPQTEVARSAAGALDWLLKRF